MSLILVSGKIGSGKDTLSSWLCYSLPSWCQFAFADSLKKYTAEKYNLNLIDFYSEEGKNKIYSDWDCSYRTLLINIGTEERLKDANVFIDHLIEQIKLSKATNVIISDFRFHNEYTRIFEVLSDVYDIKTVRINRPGLPESEYSNDLSETSLDDFNFDIVLENDSTIGSLGQSFIDKL